MINTKSITAIAVLAAASASKLSVTELEPFRANNELALAQISDENITMSEVLADVRAVFDHYAGSKWGGQMDEG